MSTTLAVALIALAGVLIAQGVLVFHALLARRDARREELLRNVRWAAEMAAGPDAGNRAIGVAALDVLDGSSLAGKEEQALITAVLETLVNRVEETYTEGDEFQTPEEVDRV